jgi:ADP-ribose pyrophosphatase
MSFTKNSDRYGAKALVQRGDEVLVTRERRSNGSIYYSLPGGGVEPSESTRDAVRRELSEELGCAGTVGGCLGSCSYTHQSIDATTQYELFAVRLHGKPAPNEREGIVGIEWHRPAAVPELMLDPLARAVRQTTNPAASE